MKIISFKKYKNHIIISIKYLCFTKDLLKNSRFISLK